MKKVVLITSAGSGKRANTEVPKQFVKLGSKPVLMHSFNTFLKFSPDIEFVLVLNDEHLDTWESLCDKHKFFIKHKLVPGGPTRFHSVKNGLKYIENKVLVAIHDGARPLVSLETISSAFQYAERFGNAIPAIQIPDSLRIVDNIHNAPLDRNKVRIIQTPQCFLSDIIKDAYNQNYDEKFTDDASVLESRGHKIFLTEGNPENIKITTSLDFKLAEGILLKK